MSPGTYNLLADMMLVAHGLFIAFVLVGLVMIWLGYFLGWRWVRRPGFRLSHLAAMAIVVGEATVGIECPLTTWENQLRELAGDAPYEASFVQYWVQRLIYYEADPALFTAFYAIFFVAMLLSLLVVKPDWSFRRLPRPQAGLPSN